MRKILHTNQIRKLDEATILEAGITSVELMERAGMACFQWLKNHYGKGVKYLIFCGPGNNGGDGLVITRYLANAGFQVLYTSPNSVKNLSEDHAINKVRMTECNAVEINYELASDEIFTNSENTIIIDCLFGSGLNRPLRGIYADMVKTINGSGVEIVSVDIPSGLYADQSSCDNDSIIKAKHTLSLQLPRLAFFMAENDVYVGDFHIIDIGLSKTCIDEMETKYFQISSKDLKAKSIQRKKHSHKGDYGHALIVAGSQGKAGAAILAVSACIRSGVGLVTASVPESIVQSINISTPEAMTIAGSGIDHLVSVPPSGRFSACGIGPGIGTNPETAFLIKQLIQDFKMPVIFDADAINILAENPTWLSFLSYGAVFTPHPGEFKRLCGESSNDFDAIDKAKAFARKYGIVLVLKGACTAVVSAKGEVFYNSTGNPGMAKGGSGDILTGLLTGLVARGYEPLDAAIRAVYLHGLAGDYAANEKGMEAMTATDIIRFIPEAIKSLGDDTNVSFALPD